MGLFRDVTECGTVYGRTGNFLGYTQFAVASPDRQRSATASISLPRTQDNEGQAGREYAALLRVYRAAICFALE